MAADRKPEDHWFAQHEEELLRQARRERERRLGEEHSARETARLEALRQSHWMKCPKCGHDLEEVDLGAARVDRCTRCEGIFLDRGELEEIALRPAQERRGLLRRLLGFGPA